MKSFMIRNVAIGQGPPKICLPITGQTLAEVQDQAWLCRQAGADLVEWRADYFAAGGGTGDPAAICTCLAMLRACLGQIPLLFTCRTLTEGGQAPLSPDAYQRLYTHILTQNGQGQAGNLPDLMDLEFSLPPDTVQTLLALAHRQKIKVVLSSHDFAATPPKEELLHRFGQMQALGGDLLKLAVMPSQPGDVLTLLDAAWTFRSQSAQRPLTAIAMGELGLISRLVGETFGFALTFGHIGRPSAPGQIPAPKLRQTLALLHRYGPKRID